ncbi:MAG: glycosyltransferase [Chitinophagaceae bacterium]
MEPLPDIKEKLFINKQNNTIKGRDIVIIGLQPWYYEIGSNCKTIATYFSQHNRVLYVNLPINRKTFFSNQKNKGVQQHCDIIKKHDDKLRPVKQNLWQFYPSAIMESINWLPSTSLFKTIDYFNNRRFAKNIRQAIQQLNFKDIILFNDNDIYNGLYLKELLAPSLYIYYCRDFLQGYDYWKKHCSVIEPQLIKKADVVLTNSTYYSDYCSKYNSKSFYIGQGCDFKLFDADKKYAAPEDINHISNPIIGYVGSLDSARLDEKIIQLIAEKNHNWSIVLVGPEDDNFKESDLHKMKNVYFIGRKPLHELPDYINAFDVCINPQFLNEITLGNYPLKIDEYLAMGKPVVATKTKAMKLFEDYVYLANNAEDYPELVQKALMENNNAKQQQRIAFAKTHSWEKSMSELYKAISNFVYTN